MKKLTRVLSLVGLAAISVGTVGALTACDKREEIVVSASSEANPYVQQLIDEFCEDNPEFDEVYKVRLEIQGEGDAATQVINDVSSAQDIFYFAQDQLSRLIVAGGLSELPSATGDDVKARNDEYSVAAATSGGALYAYPATSDNGYFAYYDKSITELDEEFNREGGPRQEELIRICEENNKTIAFNIATSGWYLASYFFATGCQSTWVADEDGNFINYVDDWNSPEGITAAQGAAELMASSCFRDDETFANTFSAGASNTGGIAVSGTWDSSSAEAILGDNLGVAPLWNFTVEGDEDNSVEEGSSETFHLGSFSGYKLVGVKPSTDADRFAWTHLLANYLTSARGQMLLFENLGWGPSNLEDQANPAIADDPILSALAEQNAYATPQGQYPNAWWDTSKALGSDIQAAAKSESLNSDLKAALEKYAASNEDTLTAVHGDYAVVGDFVDESWNVSPVVGLSQYALHEGNADEGTYKGEGIGKWTVTLNVAKTTNALEDGTVVGTFRVCDWGDWTGNWGYTELKGTIPAGVYEWTRDNNIACVPGTYTLVFDATGSTPTLTLTEA